MLPLSDLLFLLAAAAAFAKAEGRHPAKAGGILAVHVGAAASNTGQLDQRKKWSRQKRICLSHTAQGGKLIMHVIGKGTLGTGRVAGLCWCPR